MHTLPTRRQMDMLAEFIAPKVLPVEESWRRTDPSQFFLPPDEVLNFKGQPVLESLQGSSDVVHLNPWKVIYSHETNKESIHKLLSEKFFTAFPQPVMQQLAELYSDERACVFLSVNDGVVDVFQSCSADDVIQISSHPYLAHSVANESVVGDEIAKRLAFSCPQELVIKIKKSSTHEPLVVIVHNSQASFSQAYAATRIVAEKDVTAKLVVCDIRKNQFAMHKHTVVCLENSSVENMWLIPNNEGQKGSFLMERQVDLHQHAQFSDMQIFCPSSSTRVTSNIRHLGERTRSNTGTMIMSDKGTLDYEPIQEHFSPFGYSSLNLKMCLTGKAKSIFQGLVKIHPEARKCEGYQLNKNLLLSKSARIDAIPRLEIFPSEVMCKHGSATGELDLNQVFYLLCRGYSQEDAYATILKSFLQDALLASQLSTEHEFMTIAEGYFAPLLARLSSK